jgi:hypothetical protein
MPRIEKKGLLSAPFCIFPAVGKGIEFIKRRIEHPLNGERRAWDGRDSKDQQGSSSGRIW